MIWHIEVTKANAIYINGNKKEYAEKMDLNDELADIDKKILLSLADSMGYEPSELFREMVDRLDEMVDET